MAIDPKSVDLRSPAGGGCLIFAGFIIGSLIGINQGQASYGAMGGVLVGVLLALLFWAIGRRR